MFGPAWVSSEPQATAAQAPAAPASGAMKVGEETVLGSTVAYAGTDRQEIKQPGASYIKVHFESLRLAGGDFVTVADPTGREVHTYHGDPTAGAARAGDSDFTRHGRKGFAAMSIDGDTAVVTLHKSSARTAEATRGLGFKVDRYWRGYSPEEVRANNGALPGQQPAHQVAVVGLRGPVQAARVPELGRRVVRAVEPRPPR